jgi:hypothetical protein
MISASYVDMTPLVKRRDCLKRFRATDCTTLMEEWERVLTDDNRRRALAGLDCNDQPMMPTQRERGLAKSTARTLAAQVRQSQAQSGLDQARAEQKRLSQQLKGLRGTQRQANRDTKAQIDRQLPRLRTRLTKAKASASFWASRGRGLGSGPPLAPNGERSRIIRFARSRHGQLKASEAWFAELGWRSFTDTKGRGILGHHQRGIPSGVGPIRRDVLSRVSPTAFAECRSAAQAFWLVQLRLLGGG